MHKVSKEQIFVFMCFYGIFMEHGQMKIGIILRCHKMKTLFGRMMTGVFHWLCCMIVKECMLGFWIVKCISPECILCSVQ